MYSQVCISQIRDLQMNWYVTAGDLAALSEVRGLFTSHLKAIPPKLNQVSIGTFCTCFCCADVFHRKRQTEAASLRVPLRLLAQLRILLGQQPSLPMQLINNVELSGMKAPMPSSSPAERSGLADQSLYIASSQVNHDKAPRKKARCLASHCYKDHV